MSRHFAPLLAEGIVFKIVGGKELSTFVFIEIEPPIDLAVTWRTANRHGFRGYAVKKRQACNTSLWQP